MTELVGTSLVFGGGWAAGWEDVEADGSWALEPDAAGGEVVGGVLVGPGAFGASAGRDVLDDMLGQWVLDTVCAVVDASSRPR